MPLEKIPEEIAKNTCGKLDRKLLTSIDKLLVELDRLNVDKCSIKCESSGSSCRLRISEDGIDFSYNVRLKERKEDEKSDSRRRS